MSARQIALIHPARLVVILLCLGLAVAALVWRAVDLQVVNQDFLQDQGNARHLRTVTIAAHRGMISDRNGEPLAISTPVDSVWANPQAAIMGRGQWPQLARLLDMDPVYLKKRIMTRAQREFVYLRRHINPDLGQQVMALNIPGIFLQREYQRYYPAGEVAAHVIGFTDVDDRGQEGVELAYNDWLHGTAGSKRVLKDRLGRIVEDVERLAAASPGRNLRLSIDLRLQYLAYRSLKTAVHLHRARSGSVVILDARTGEILAMVNQPSYNPNNRGHMRSDHLRNRALTDVFEPGSTVKPFTIAAALESGKYRPNSVIDTSPGYYRVGRNSVRDVVNYGAIDVTTVIQKSSNVGASKIALSLEPERLWSMFSQVGFGALTGCGFPGEVSGLLTDYWRWHDFERATLSFGYGLSVTTLQLAHAYSTLAAGGRLRPLSLLSVKQPPEGKAVMSGRTAAQVLAMMETVISAKGTGKLAHVRGYRVAGKTGTVQKNGVDGYSDERYLALFAGIAPASRPRLVMAVLINEPRDGEYYGGRVAAPVFAEVMTGALRLLGVAPDDVPAAVRPVQHESGHSILPKPLRVSSVSTIGRRSP